uniref:ribonuclease H n=1 Tax=Pelodiscus sinensis TaxID=13735 RepID=K7F199_PELSI
MPFGLPGAAATFQWLMDRVLSTHKDYAVACIDDIIIFSNSWGDHLQHVDKVLQALRQAGLTANPRKCQFGKREVSYLGYTVGNGQLRPILDKVRAIRDYPRPNTKRQVRQFLGLAGYYRQFIEHFASVAAPLTDMTRNSKPQRVVWGPREAQAFETLRRALITEPVLRQPDFEKPFVVQTDASEVGLGAVLAQEKKGVEHPMAYLSRKLLPQEKHYATIEKEALAIKWAVDSLRYFLLGNHFTLVTDHAPLKWIQNMKDTNARILR